MAKTATKRETARGHGRAKNVPGITAWFCFAFCRVKMLISETSGYHSTAAIQNRQSWPWVFIEVESDSAYGDDPEYNAMEKAKETNDVLRRLQNGVNGIVNDSQYTGIGNVINQLEKLGWKIHDDLIGKENVPPLKNMLSKPQSRRHGKRTTKWHNLDAAIRTEQNGNDDRYSDRQRDIEELQYQTTRIGSVITKPFQAPINTTADNRTEQEEISAAKQQEQAEGWHTIADEIIDHFRREAEIEAEHKPPKHKSDKPILLGNFPVETAYLICKHINGHYKIKALALRLSGSLSRTTSQQVFIPATTPPNIRQNIRSWLKRMLKRKHT